jgi:lipopolysaccharide/colanic/teichoic acid biosynthesis glycosyltransferase
MSVKGVLSRRLFGILIDSILFWLSLLIALFIRRSDIFSIDYFLSHFSQFLPVYLLFILSMYVVGIYDVFSLISKSNKVKLITYVLLLTTIFGSMYFYFFPDIFSPKTVLLLQTGILLIFEIVWSISQESFIVKNTKSRAIILDNSLKGLKIKRDVVASNFPIEFVESLKLSLYDYDKYSKNNFMDIIRSARIKIIIVDLEDIKIRALLPHLYELSKMGIRLIDVNSLYEYLYKKVSLDSINYKWFFKEVKVNTRLYELTKRVMDIILCVPVYIAWAFLHPWVRRVIKQEDAGEIYSTQERLGKFNEKISIKKYRTMNFTDKGEWLEKSQNKVTETGKFLRKTRIDELPQIFSVIRGDLSFIGPRTDIINLGDKLCEEIPFYNLRYNVTPGLSGWAQVNMNYQPRTVEDSKERLEYDLYYVKNRSIVLDIIIMLKTIKTILGREGS